MVQILILNCLGGGNALYLSMEDSWVPQEQPTAEMTANTTSAKQVLGVS